MKCVARVHLGVKWIVGVLAEEHTIVVRVVALWCVEWIVMDIVSVADIIQEMILVWIHWIIVFIILVDHPFRVICFRLLT